MNRIKAIITDIQSSGNLSLIRMQADDLVLTSVILDTADSSPFIARNKEVVVLFKETEVILSRSNPDDLSLRNRIPGTITAIDTGALLGRIVMNSRYGIIRSMITASAIKQLDLKVGDSVYAMIKTNELMLSEE